MSQSETTTVLFDLSDRPDSCLIHALGRILVEVVNGEQRLSAGVTLHDKHMFRDSVPVGTCQVIGRNRVVIEIHDVFVELAEAEGYAGVGPHRPRMTEAWAAKVVLLHAAAV
jgi:hypothetical protein